VLAERLDPVLSRIRARRGGLAIGVWAGDETLTLRDAQHEYVLNAQGSAAAAP